MRKLSVFCAICFLLLAASGFAFAQEVTNTIGIGARVFYYSPQSEDVFGASVDIENDLAVGLNLTYIVTQNFSLELAWNYFKTDIEEGSFKLGEFTTMPFMLTCQFRLTPMGPIIPYVGGGVGYFINKFDESSEAEENAEVKDIDIDNSLGLHTNAGLDWFLTDNFALNLDAKYLFTEADIEGEEGDSKVTGDIDFEALTIGSGIKFYF
jgi:outer membrane protein W